MIPVVRYFAVDKGNMTLVEFPNGINMMIDCRVSETRPSPLEYLKAKIKNLHFVVITHPHQDHLTGVKEVCEHFKPQYLWHNGRYFKPDPVYDDWDYYEKLRNGKIGYCTPVKVQAHQVFRVEDSKLTIAGPLTPNIEGTSDDENNNSIILRLACPESSFVFTGDTQQEQWEKTNLNLLGNSSVFLASHHGRENGYHEAALKVIRPTLIVISDGEPGETDATAKYQKFATVKTTRKGSIVIQPQVAAAAD